MIKNLKGIRRDIFLLGVGTALGILATLLTGAISSNRNESFELAQQRRVDIKTVHVDIQNALSAIDASDERALNAAIEHLQVSTLYLPDYKSMILPLLFAITYKNIEENDYRIQSFDTVSGKSTIKKSSSKP